MCNPHPLRETQIGHLYFRTGDKSELANRIIKRLKRTSQSKDPVGNYLVGFLNPHVFNLSCQYPVVEKFINRCDAVCIDGVGVKLAILAYRGQLVPRVVAEHLFAAFIDRLDFPVEALLIGGAPGQTEIAARAISEKNPYLRITGILDGYSDESTCRDFLQRQDNVPLILIGAGTPGSETLGLLAKELAVRAVVFHIGGGTLNTFSGHKKRGPLWISRIGMEWLHRFIHEPATRQRYTIGGLLFMRNLLSVRSAKQ